MEKEKLPQYGHMGSADSFSSFGVCGNNSRYSISGQQWRIFFHTKKLKFIWSFSYKCFILIEVKKFYLDRRVQKMAEKEKMEIAIISEEEIKSKIFIIRGQKAMLDEDLAMIYGYTTKAFNQQVKNNIAKFDEDFRFQLTNEEVEELSRSRILTSMQEKGTKGGRTYNPYIFTEQGIYMLMTVLRGDLAVRQSKDGGRRTTLLSRLEDIQLYDDMIKQLLGNPVLKLK